jgi:predicted nucleic acid-binding protein
LLAVLAGQVLVLACSQVQHLRRQLQFRNGTPAALVRGREPDGRRPLAAGISHARVPKPSLQWCRCRGTAAQIRSGRLRGRSKISRRPSNSAGGWRCSSFVERAANHYGQLWAELERAGQGIGLHDMTIGGHARSKALTMVTNDVRGVSTHARPSFGKLALAFRARQRILGHDPLTGAAFPSTFEGASTPN